MHLSPRADVYLASGVDVCLAQKVKKDDYQEKAKEDTNHEDSKKNKQ